jgi:hypothetical protein
MQCWLVEVVADQGEAQQPLLLVQAWCSDLVSLALAWQLELHADLAPVRSAAASAEEAAWRPQDREG